MSALHDPDSTPATTTIEGGVDLFRIHQAEHHPAFFDTSRHGRFNPHEALTSQFGTLYVGTSPAAAFVETLGRVRYLSQREVDRRRLSVVRFSTPLRLLDLADRHNRFPYPGVDLAGDAILGSAEYTSSQQLAAAVNHDDRFDGVIYPVRHDNAGRYLGVAVFGPPRQQEDIFASVATGPIPAGLIEQMVDEFGFEIIPDSPLP